jgi:uncharacterized protein YbjT (DUF2867 family)
VHDDVDEQAEPISNFHAELERLLEKSTLDWTFLRPSGFASNTRGWARQDSRGRRRARAVWRGGQITDSRAGYRDLAERALSGHGHGGRKYVLIGPATLTQVEQAHAIGRPVRYEEISPEAALEQMVAEGWPRTFAEGALNAWAGLVTEPEVVTSTVEEVTAVSARTFGQWAIDYAGEFS